MCPVTVSAAEWKEGGEGSVPEVDKAQQDLECLHCYLRKLNSRLVRLSTPDLPSEELLEVRRFALEEISMNSEETAVHLKINVRNRQS